MARLYQVLYTACPTVGSQAGRLGVMSVSCHVFRTNAEVVVKFAHASVSGVLTFRLFADIVFSVHLQQQPYWDITNLGYAGKLSC